MKIKLEQRVGAALRGARGVLLAFTWTLAPPVLGAEPEPLLSETEFLSDLPVVLSASRLSQPAGDAPSATTVIDREMIRASGARDIAEVFRLVPGFYVSYFNGNQPIVAYHGLTDQFSRRMQVLVDGRSVYGQLLSAVDWVDVPLALEDVERIEVVRGPSAAAHGANSFMGVINIITRHPALDRGVYAAVTAGEEGVTDTVIKAGGATETLDWRLTGNIRSDSGYNEVSDTKHIHQLNFRGDWRMTARDTLQAQLGYSNGPRARGMPDDTLDPSRSNWVNAHFEQLRWTRAFGAGDEVYVQFYHTYRNSNDEHLTLPIGVLGNARFPIDDSIATHRFDLELQHTFSLSNSLRGVWGGSIRRDEADSPVNLTKPVETRLKRLFAHLEWRPWEPLVVNLGAMYEDNSITGTDVSPRASLNYRLAPGHTVRVGVSEALRSPIIFEEFANRRFQFGPIRVQSFLASGGLQPEFIRSRELGYVGEFQAAALTVDLRLFSDEFGGLIDTVRVPLAGVFLNQTLDFRNIDIARQEGIEAQFRWRPTRGTLVVLGLSALDTDSPDRTTAYSTSAPAGAMSLLVSQTVGPYTQLSANYFRQGKLEALGFSSPQKELSRLDLRVAHRLDAYGLKGGEASLVVQDLLNDNYQEYREENFFGRRAFLRLSMEF